MDRGYGNNARDMGEWAGDWEVVQMGTERDQGSNRLLPSSQTARRPGPVQVLVAVNPRQTGDRSYLLLLASEGSCY